MQRRSFNTVILTTYIPKVLFNKKVIAKADELEDVEGNIYFPPKSIRKEYFESTNKITVRPWKTKASYYDIEVDGKKPSKTTLIYKKPQKKTNNTKTTKKIFFINFYP